MKTKLLAIMAIAAMVFAGFAMTGDSSDATAGDITLAPTAPSIEVGDVIVMVATIEGDTGGTTVNWESGTTATATVGSATSVTDSQGKAYMTVTAVAAGTSAVKASTATNTTGDTETVTVAAASGVTLNAWAYDSTNKMYVFQYSDGTMMIDTKYMNLGVNQNVIVGITVASEAEYYIDALSAKEKVWVDLGAQTNNTSITVKLYSYDTKTGIGEATLTYSTSALSLKINQNYGTTIGDITLANIGKGESVTLNGTTFPSLTRDNFTLIGFSSTQTRASAGTLDILPGASTIEDIIMADWNGDKTQTAATEVPQIFAAWSNVGYTITIIEDVQASGDSVATASGTEFIQAGSNGYGLINIVKLDAKKGTEYTYSFDVKLTSTGASATGHYTLDMLTNGTFKLSGVDADLTITVSATAWTVDPSSYRFAINSIENTTTTNYGGTVTVSLDLYDYTPTDDQTIGIKGTYFKVIDDQRVFGNIANLEVGTAVGQKNFSAYGDKIVSTENDSPIHEKVTDGVITTVTGAQSYDLVLTTVTATETGAVYLYATQGVWDTNGSTTGGEVYTPVSLYKGTAMS